MISLIFYTIAILLYSLICRLGDFQEIPFRDLCDIFIDKKQFGSFACPPSDPQNVDDVCCGEKSNPIFEWLYSLILFFFSINLVAFIAGNRARDIIHTYDLDLKYSLLRLKSDWYNLITGRQFIFDYYNSTVFLKSHIIWIEAIVDVGKTTILYEGMLTDYKLRGDTSYLCLTKVITWHLDDEYNWKRSVLPPSNIQSGQYTVLKLEEIKNVNVSVYLIKRHPRNNHNKTDASKK